MQQQLVQEITGMVHRTRGMPEPDPALLGRLDKLELLLERVRDRWYNDPNKGSVYFYHAARVAWLVLREMKAVFENYESSTNQDTIIKDSLDMLPLIDDIIKIAETSKISEESIDSASSKSGELMDVVYDNDFADVLVRDMNSTDRKFVGFNLTQPVEGIIYTPGGSSTKDE